MRGILHEVDVLNQVFDDKKGWVPSKPYVYISNSDDSHYYMQLETVAEVDEFIAKLEAAKQKAFCQDYSKLRGWPYVTVTAKPTTFNKL